MTVEVEEALQTELQLMQVNIIIVLLWNHGHIVILETIRIGLLCLISTHGQSFIVGAALHEYRFI